MKNENETPKSTDTTSEGIQTKILSVNSTINKKYFTQSVLRSPIVSRVNKKMNTSDDHTDFEYILQDKAQKIDFWLYLKTMTKNDPIKVSKKSLSQVVSRTIQTEDGKIIISLKSGKTCSDLYHYLPKAEIQFLEYLLYLKEVVIK